MNSILYLRACSALCDNLYRHLGTKVIKKQLLSTSATGSKTTGFLLMELFRRPPSLLKNVLSCQYFVATQKMDLRFGNVRRYSSRHAKLSSRKVPNLYDVLEVSPKANASEIKSAFYNLSKTYHPDVNKSEEAVEKFAEILSAYEILGNQTKRRMYDRGTMTHPRFGVSPRKETHDRDGQHHPHHPHRHHRNPTRAAGFGHRAEGSGPGPNFKSAAGRPGFKFNSDFEEYYSAAMESRQFTKREAEFFMQKHYEDERTRRFRGIATGSLVFLFLAGMFLQALRSRTISTSPNNKKDEEK